MHKFTRIVFNSFDWQKPTGDAPQELNTYYAKYGFGHEEWLFRTDWLIDGWRYTFLQGVNKSYENLLKNRQPIDITLYTRQPDNRRRYVGTIYGVECINNQQASDALDEFKSRGWYAMMLEEIKAINGEVSALGAAQWTKEVLNIRFRMENVRRFLPNTWAEPNDPVRYWNHYQLYEPEKGNYDFANAAIAKRLGSPVPPSAFLIHRNGIPPTEYTPEHRRMQAKLMEELAIEYPGIDPICERDFIDVIVETADELILFEIKSDIEPRRVIRSALGQLLEYAFYPLRSHTKNLKLVIVGRYELTTADEKYLQRLKNDFRLPIDYRLIRLT